MAFRALTFQQAKQAQSRYHAARERLGLGKWEHASPIEREEEPDACSATLAREYGVSGVTMWNAVNGYSYRQPTYRPGGKRTA